MSGTQVQKVRSVGVFRASSRCASVISSLAPPELSELGLLLSELGLLLSEPALLLSSESVLDVQPASVNAAAAAIEVIATAALRAPCLMIAQFSQVVGRKRPRIRGRVARRGRLRPTVRERSVFRRSIAAGERWRARVTSC